MLPEHDVVQTATPRNPLNEEVARQEDGPPPPFDTLRP